ncbi:hypothetical protein Bhyg_16076, partial [Pseudolycoriella hygida]
TKFCFNVLSRQNFIKSSSRLVHYNNGGEYDLLDKFNYVGNHGVYWTHPQSQFVIRLTDDLEKCTKGNRLDDDTCWLYFSKSLVGKMTKDFNEPQLIDVMNEVRNWKYIQSSPQDISEFLVGLTRICSTFPNVSREQKLFGTKNLISTFLVDDVVEKLYAQPELNAVAVEYTNNLHKIFSNRFDQVIDMNQFKCQHKAFHSEIEEATQALDCRMEKEKHPEFEQLASLKSWQIC